MEFFTVFVILVMASKSLTFVLEPTFLHGWTSHGGKQYHAVLQPMNSSEAEAYCRGQMATLARPSSADENAFIAKLLPGSYLWIDARKIEAKKVAWDVIYYQEEVHALIVSTIFWVHFSSVCTTYEHTGLVSGDEYRWSDGAALTWYKWDSHQNFHDDCVTISGKDTDWLDVSCQGTAAFVCQKDITSNTTCAPGGHVYTVSSAAEIASGQNVMQPGDTLQWADGIYHDLRINLTKSGLANCGKKIYLRAKTPGKVILTGNTHIQYSGNYIDVEGIQVTGYTSHPEVAVTFGKGTHHNRFAESAIANFNPSNTPHRHVWMEIWGSHHTIERNAFVGKTYLGEMLRVKGDTSNTRESWGHRIAYNYFGPRSVPANGGESIQIGLENHQHLLETVVEYNYFFGNLVNHSGDVEIISIKSSNNTVRYNTFEDCGGLVSFRFGDINVAEGNFFICHHVDGCGGVRMRGSDHKVINNYIDGAAGKSDARGGINLISDESGNRNIIAFNTLYSCDTCIQIGTGSGKHTLSDNIFSNNVVQGHNSHSYLVWSGSENNTLFEANVMHTGQITNQKYGSNIFSDLHLVKNDLGLYIPAPGSPAVQSASGSYSHVVHDDILGRARTNQPTDKGAILSDISATEHAHRKPLHRGDVGPTWAPDDSHLTGH